MPSHRIVYHIPMTQKLSKNSKKTQLKTFQKSKKV